MKDKELRQTFYKKPCIICRKVPSDPCHIKSYGSGGADNEINMISMCRQHHSEQHQIGWKRMAEKYKPLQFALSVRGFHFDENNKLRRDNAGKP